MSNNIKMYIRMFAYQLWLAHVNCTVRSGEGSCLTHGAPQKKL